MQLSTSAHYPRSIRLSGLESSKGRTLVAQIISVTRTPIHPTYRVLVLLACTFRHIGITILNSYQPDRGFKARIRLVYEIHFFFEKKNGFLKLMYLPEYLELYQNVGCVGKGRLSTVDLEHLFVNLGILRGP